MPALGNAPAIRRRLGERVAFHDRDSDVRVGQYPGGEQPGHARAEDHRVLTDLPHVLRRYGGRGPGGFGKTNHAPSLGAVGSSM